jgi:hypothetical protein
VKEGGFYTGVGEISFFWRTPLPFGYDSVMNFFIVEGLGKKVDRCDSKRVIEREVWNVPRYSSIVPKYLVRSLVGLK